MRKQWERHLLGVHGSIRRASTELQIPRSTIHKIIHKRLHLCAFTIQLRHHTKFNHCPLRAHFAAEMLLRIEKGNSYLDNNVFSDEATFHLCAKINKHNCRIWGSTDLIPLDFFLGICEECCLPWRQTYNFGGTEGPHHKCCSACDCTNATEHLAGGWIPFRCVQSHQKCTHRAALTILQNLASFYLKLCKS